MAKKKLEPAKESAYKQFSINLGLQIHYARVARNLTVEDFAELIDVEPRTVYRYESGRSLSLEALFFISRILNVDFSREFRKQ